MSLTASTRREHTSALVLFIGFEKITVFVERERRWERCCVFIGKCLCRALNRQVWVDVESIEVVTWRHKILRILALFRYSVCHFPTSFRYPALSRIFVS